MTASETAAEMTTTIPATSHLHLHNSYHTHHHHHHHHHHSFNNQTYYSSETMDADQKTLQHQDKKLKVITNSNAILGANSTSNSNYLPSSPSFLCLTPSSSSNSSSSTIASSNVNQTKSTSITTSNITTTTAASTATTTTSSTSTSTTNQIDEKQQMDVVNKESEFKKRKDNEDFLKRLYEFHKHKNINTPVINWPTLNGKQIDLLKLYLKVVSAGGWERVCEKEKWSQIFTDLFSKEENEKKSSDNQRIIESCTMGSHALKLIYIRYLSSFEKVLQIISNSSANGSFNMQQPLQLDAYNLNLHLNNLTSTQVNILLANNNSNQSQTSISNGGTGTGTTYNGVALSQVPGLGYKSSSVLSKDDDLISELDAQLNNKRRFSYLIDSTQMTYNYNQHAQFSMQHSKSHLVYNAYEKLEMSMLSGLPNEIDFAFNTLLLLSSDEMNMFRVYTSPHLIDLMLAHIGFFGSKDTQNYRILYENIWNPISKNETSKTRDEMITYYLNNEDTKVLSDQLLNEPAKPKFKQFIHFWHRAIQLSQQQLQSGEAELITSFLQKDSSDSQSYTFKMEHKRIEQVLVILNNLSFEEKNAKFMANKCSKLIEFLIVCLNCRTNDQDEDGLDFDQIRYHALDIMINLSRKLKLKRLNESNKRLLLNTLSYLIRGHNQTIKVKDLDMNSTSIDPVDISKSLEILTKLCSQQITSSSHDHDHHNDYDDDYFVNEKHLFQFDNQNFLDNLFQSIEQLLSTRKESILVIMNSLECLYNMTQHSESICNIIVNNSDNSNYRNKLIGILVNFLTIDMSHFNLKEENSSLVQPIKIYKAIPPNGLVIPPLSQSNNSKQSIAPQQQQQPLPTNSVPLLQQTLLNNQLNNALNLAKANSNSNGVSTQEQQARQSLNQWLTTCFQADEKSELSKTQLYPYYQQIAKMNNWSVLTIPVFFEVLNETFPKLNYDDTTSKIRGLKLVLNVKQQLQLKQQQQQQQQHSNQQNSINTVNNNSSNSNTNINNLLNQKDAALLALKRHQTVRKEDLMTLDEGPITKSIRLLAALTLRNLAKNSEKARNSIKPFESHLTTIAFDLVESSNAVSTCLWYLSH